MCVWDFYVPGSNNPQTIFFLYFRHVCLSVSLAFYVFCLCLSVHLSKSFNLTLKVQCSYLLFLFIICYHIPSTSSYNNLSTISLVGVGRGTSGLLLQEEIGVLGENSPVKPDVHKPAHVPASGIVPRTKWWETRAQTFPRADAGNRIRAVLVSGQSINHWVSRTAWQLGFV